MPEILFVSAPYHCGVVEVAGRWIPLQFCYLADAAAKAGVESEIFDAMSLMVDHETVREKIQSVQPDYLGLSSITATLPDVLEIARYAREVSPQTRILLGGIHPTFLPQEIFNLSNDIDIIFMGEAEETLKEFLKADLTGSSLDKVSGLAFRNHSGTCVTSPRPFIDDLESYRPRFDLLDWKNYQYFVIPDSRLGALSTSRGCTHDCSFCSQQKFWQKTWRPREVGPILDELKLLYETYGVNVILIGDEYPTSDRDRWIELLKGIRALDYDNLYLLMETRVDDIVRDADILPLYREAGIVHVYVGVEATRQETLDYIKKEIDVDSSRQALKLLRDHHFISETSFVLGFPDETTESIENTLELAYYYNPDFAHFLTITPWPYADLYEEVKDSIAETDYRKYNLIDPIIRPEGMTLDEVDLALVECYRKFYTRKFTQVLKEPNEFKRGYLMKSMQLIMKSSFIIEKLKRFPLWRKKAEQMMKKWTS